MLKFMPRSLVALAALLFSTGCGGGSVTAPPIPPGGTAPQSAGPSASATVPVSASGASATLAIGGATEKFVFPAVQGAVPAGASLKLAGSSTAPAGLPPLAVRRQVLVARGRAKPLTETFVPALYATVVPSLPITFVAAPYIGISGLLLSAGANYGVFLCVDSGCTQWQQLSSGVPSGTNISFTPEPNSPALSIPAGGAVIAIAQVLSNPITVSSTSLTIANGNPGSFKASEIAYSGNLAVTASGPFKVGISPSDAVNTITGGPSGTTFYVGTIGSPAIGTTGTVTVTDSPGLQAGQTADSTQISLVVGTTTSGSGANPIVINTGSPIASFAAGTVTPVTVTEAGYSGRFFATLTGSAQNVAVVSPQGAPTTNGSAVTFYLGGLGSGTQTLQITDGSQTVTAALSVSAAAANVTVLQLPTPATVVLSTEIEALLFPPSANSAGYVAITTLGNATGSLPSPSLPTGAHVGGAISVTTLSPTLLGSNVQIAGDPSKIPPAGTMASSFGEEFYVPMIPGAPAIPGVSFGQWNAIPSSPCTAQLICTFNPNAGGAQLGSFAIPAGLTFGFLIDYVTASAPQTSLYVADPGTDAIKAFPVSAITSAAAGASITPSLSLALTPSSGLPLDVTFMTTPGFNSSGELIYSGFVPSTTLGALGALGLGSAATVVACPLSGATFTCSAPIITSPVPSVDPGGATGSTGVAYDAANQTLQVATNLTFYGGPSFTNSGMVNQYSVAGTPTNPSVVLSEGSMYGAASNQQPVFGTLAVTSKGKVGVVVPDNSFGQSVNFLGAIQICTTPSGGTNGSCVQLTAGVLVQPHAIAFDPSDSMFITALSAAGAPVYLNCGSDPYTSCSSNAIAAPAGYIPAGIAVDTANVYVGLTSRSQTPQPSLLAVIPRSGGAAKLITLGSVGLAAGLALH